VAGVNRIGGGLLVDPDRPISFTFEGRSYTGLAGDTIASALAANDQWLLSRSFKYHRPRGILTMAGQDANTLVQLDGQPNVHADRHPIADGLRVRAQNVTGSLEGDRGFVLNRLGRFLPVGFYYRAFFRPRGIWYRFWELLIRKGAGLGSVDLTAEHAYYDKAFAHFDVAVIGGGPAGLSAALAAAETGAEVLLVDDAPMLGGSLTYARFDADGYLAAETRARLLAAIETEKRINVMTDAACNAWYADNWLAVIQGNRLWKVRAKRVVFATGAIEQPAVFRDNDLPGVMLGSAAQRLIRLYGVRPGTRAVVLAGNDAAYAVALDLAEAGVDVAAIADLRPHPPIEPLRAAAKDRGLTVLDGQAVREAVPATGHRHVRGIVIASTDGAERTIDCDVVCMSVGYTPAYHLPLQAGAKLGYDDETAMFSLDDLPDTVQLVGAVNGDFSLYASGERSTCVNHPWPIFPHPKGKEFVDFDEDLQVHDIRDAVADGYRELELVKRFSTVGMGPSQGRQSALTTARLAADATGRTVAHVGVTTARPPVFGEKLGVLAGRSFEPERRTPMHHRHLEAGAQMMPVGLWWRPSFYGAEADRDARIADEARNVRENVGLIDVSTLGGLDIRGPDAAEFLNRVYTFAYVKQPVGRARYVLMTNEAGSVIDDGVACRLSDDHFYVTATTGAAETVYLTMLWWNAQWRLDVDIANVTAAYAGVNVAGPRAREVVAPLIEDIDLSAEAFPYMGVRTGQVAGIPTRNFRVGFVGELGYEIHVPASTGEALWDALIDAGRPAGLRPFGVEAQRVLRLEKGHVIVGQDTDAMTTPEELDMTWAIARKKPFFVGERSLRIRDRHLSARKLVGFTLPADGPCPQDSNLVLRDGTMAGFVTSVARSPVLNRIVGLAYTARDESQPGDPVRIHLDDGRDIVGEVVPLPFYDPDNARQEN